MWKGQTTILRFNLIINQEPNAKLTLAITSNINEIIKSPNVLEIQRFFIASVGFNYPCINSRIRTLSPESERRDKNNNKETNEDGSWNYKVGESFEIERLNYFPFEANNVSASTVTN